MGCLPGPSATTANTEPEGASGGQVPGILDSSSLPGADYFPPALRYHDLGSTAAYGFACEAVGGNRKGPALEKTGTRQAGQPRRTDPRAAGPQELRAAQAQGTGPQARRAGGAL